MRGRNFLRATRLLLALFMITAGQSFAQTFDIVTLVSPNEQMLANFGHSVSGTGDINHDGFEDVIVGAYREDPGTSPDDAGRAYLFSGLGGLLFELISPHEEEGGFFGVVVSGVGDVNQDGFPDVIVGANREDPGTSPDDAGRAYIYSGQDGALLFELTSPNEEAGGLFGRAVSGVGDVNQDGFADVIVGARFEDPSTSPDDAGRAYLFSGQDGSLLFELISPNEEFDGEFGFAVSGAGDFNQDGIADVIVGAVLEDPGASPDDAGRAYVFSGQDGSLLVELMSPNEEIDGQFGFSVSGAGDVNQDGFADVIVGAVLEDPGTSPANAGRAYIFSGEDHGLLFELISPNEQGDGFFGSAVAVVGDVDQNKFVDVIVGAREENPGNSPSGAGRAYIFGGQDGSLLVELKSPNEEASGLFGFFAAGAGDVNGDGLADVIVSALLEDPGDSPLNAGRAYIFVSSSGQPQVFRINAGGPNYTDTSGDLFAADQAYVAGSYGYVGGRTRRFDKPVGGTQDDPLYQDLRVVREGSFAYRFDVASDVSFDVTLYLMAPALEGAGSIVMDVQAEDAVVFDDLDVTVEAGGAYRALIKTFTVDVNDGRLDLRFRAVNKAAVVSAIAVVQQTGAQGSLKPVNKTPG